MALHTDNFITSKPYTGLQFHSASAPPRLAKLDMPAPTAGTVVVRPLYAIVVQYANQIFANGNPRGYKYPLPFVPGGTCVARVEAVPPDAARLTPGQLVFVEMTVRARDDADTKVLRGFSEGATAGTRRLLAADSPWRNGVWATLATAPLEGVHALDEEVLVSQLGYRIEELGALSQLVVPYGGLADIGVKAGETVLIAPATGTFGSGAVHIAAAMGARVIAMGRNDEALAKLSQISDRVSTVKISGDVEEDTKVLARFGPLDVFFDISPASAKNSSHFQAGIASLRTGGRVSLMGGLRGGVELPYSQITHKGLTIKGTFMNTAQQARDLIKLIERDILKIGSRSGMEARGKYRLEEWEEAFSAAAEKSGPGNAVYFTPNVE